MDQTLGEMFEKAAERASNLKNRQVVIDFSDVESIDAIGLLLCGYGLHHFVDNSVFPLHLSTVFKPPVSGVMLLPVLQEHGLPEIPPVFLEALREIALVKKREGLSSLPGCVPPSTYA